MKIQTRWAGTAAALLAAAPCWPAQWFAVGGPRDAASGPLVEVDLDTLGARRRGGEAVIRVSYAAPQAHEDGFRYRSFVGNAQFDCQRRIISLTSAAFYPLPQGQGDRMGTDSSGSVSGKPAALLESIPAPERQALLRASCATAQPAS
ncbi:MAG TPA: surface-adhesin E family protein [Ramlibacter sp.]